MKKIGIAGLAAILSFAMAGVVFAAAPSTTVKGHLRDSFCYTLMGAKGSSHHQCAVDCAKAGIPVMLVSDSGDKTYILLPSKDKQALPSSITSKMEDEIAVTGHTYTKGGVNFLQVESVK